MDKKVSTIESLIKQFNKLPGIGVKSATRIAYHIIDESLPEVEKFANAIIEAKKNIHYCERCFNFSDGDLCEICRDSSRDESILCVVEYPKDLDIMERTDAFNGLYHVLHGVIDPSKGIDASKIKLDELIQRVLKGNFKEIIVATNPTHNGDMTALYIDKMLAPLSVKVTRIAYGLPVGADMEYYDNVTIKAAMANRRIIRKDNE